MSDSNKNPAFKVGVEVSESFAKWLVSNYWWCLVLAFAIATGGVKGILDLTNPEAPASGLTSERVVPPK